MTGPSWEAGAVDTMRLSSAVCADGYGERAVVRTQQRDRFHCMPVAKCAMFRCAQVVQRALPWQMPIQP
jgi:hypothetical protein